MTDYTAFKNLYLLCFTEDTEEDAELLFKNVFSKAKMICEYNESGAPIAMLFLMDANIIQQDNSFPFYYLYAACTHPDYRGRGIMGNLLEKAKETAVNDNKLGIFLKPANPSLFKFYARSDFFPYFNVCKIITSADEFTNTYSPKFDNVNQTTMALWQVIRQAFLNELDCAYVDFSKEILTTAADGSTPLVAEDFGFVYELRNDTLLIKEALCKHGHTEELLCAISHIVQSLPCKKVEIRLPSVFKDELTQFGNTVQPFSVMWHAHDTTKYYEGTSYHGFAFD